MVLTLCFAVGRVECSVQSVASTVYSLVMSPGLSIEDVRRLLWVQQLPRNYLSGEWKYVFGETKRLHHGYLYGYLSGQRTVD